VPAFVREQQTEKGSPWFLEEGEPPLSYSQIRKLLNRAKVLISRAGEGEREELLQRALAQRNSLYARALQTGDYRACLSILDSRDRLLRLFPREEGGNRPGPTGERLVLNVIETLVINQEKPPLQIPAAPVLQLAPEIANYGTDAEQPAQDGEATPGRASLPA